MAEKLYDVAVATGEYTNSQGEQKKRFLNIGAIISGDHGPYMLMEKTFNPAGVAGQEGRGSIMVSLFKPRDRNDAPSEGGYNKHDPNTVNKPWENKQPASAGPPPTNFEDDIPF